MCVKEINLKEDTGMSWIPIYSILQLLFKMCILPAMYIGNEYIYLVIFITFFVKLIEYPVFHFPKRSLNVIANLQRL